MAEFQELIKNFDRTRDYIREFFVYGFKSRGEFSEKSGRTYDNERRRLESWLGGYIQESHTARGKQVAISVDSKSIPQNPLYGAWKSISFTDRDIQLHFFLLDCLWNQPAGKTARELCDEMAEAYGQVFDSQTVRLKLKEYEELGILGARKAGKSLRYYLPAGPVEEITAGMTADAVDMTSGAVVGTASDVIVGAGAELVVKRNSAGKLWNHLMTAVAFFQEAAPFGFVGSTYAGGRDFAGNPVGYAAGTADSSSYPEPPQQAHCAGRRDPAADFCQHTDGTAVSVHVSGKETAFFLLPPGFYPENMGGGGLRRLSAKGAAPGKEPVLVLGCLLWRRG